jgi:hypothetical protein
MATSPDFRSTKLVLYFNLDTGVLTITEGVQKDNTEEILQRKFQVDGLPLSQHSSLSGVLAPGGRISLTCMAGC